MTSVKKLSITLPLFWMTWRRSLTTRSQGLRNKEIRDAMVRSRCMLQQCSGA
jgi:hypothetical protein